MLSKIRFWPLALLCACRLGTARPDGAEGPAGSALSSVTSTTTTPPAASLAATNAEPAASGDSGASTRADLPSKPVVLGWPAPGAEADAEPPALAEPRTPRSHRVVVLGDSLSDARVGGGGYLLAIHRSCPGARVENLAKGGWMVNQMRRRFEAEVLPRLPSEFDELIVFGGVNDLYSDETAGRTFAKISSDLGFIYRSAKSRGVRVIAVTVTPWGGFTRYYSARRAAATRQLNTWLKEQQEQGLVDVVVDANPLLSCGDAERLCAEYAAPFRDGLHFGKIGQRKLGQELLRTAFADCPGVTEDPSPPER